MQIRSLTLRQFRNYEELVFTPSQGLNLLAGENGAGKSNLLEAVYILATTRSLRASRESELIKHGGEAALISGDIEREREPEVGLEVAVFQSDKKSVRINGIKKARVIELLGQLNVVFFGSADVGIVAGEPSQRRRYLNVEISQISPKYVFDLSSYKKALEQRNRLLRDIRERHSKDTSLEAWSEQLVAYGAPMIEKRRFFLDRLAPIAAQVHQDLTEGCEELRVLYHPSIPLTPNSGVESIAHSFRCEIEKVSQEEIRRGVTLVGPQRDDVQLLINGQDARAFGSQGQQRTVALSLKLAQFQLMEEYVGEPPVVLLDDVMSDLDDRRRRHLLSWIHPRCQTFLTCTSLRSFPDSVLADATVYDVEAGRIIKGFQSGSRPSAEHPTPGPDLSNPVEAG